jgi:hypothetical protein
MRWPPLCLVVAILVLMDGCKASPPPTLPPGDVDELLAKIKANGETPHKPDVKNNYPDEDSTLKVVADGTYTTLQYLTTFFLLCVKALASHNANTPGSGVVATGSP